MDNLVKETLDTSLIGKSVIDLPAIKERQQPRAAPIILTVAARSQNITPWGYNFKRRDQELRSFWHTESWLASVVYSVSIRNASFAWEIEGSDPTKKRPKNTIETVKKIIKNSNMGKGWKHFITQTCIDLFTADNGAFWEIIRNGSSPNSPVVNLVHLDSGRCQRTGDPKYPVIYTDRKGNERVLRWYQVKTIEEMPSPIEEVFGIGHCAVSRALLAAEIIQSISVYKHEKVSGTFSKAVDIVSGVTQHEIDDALSITEEQNLNKNLYRYSLPTIIPGIDPSSTLSHVHIDLASLPDNFNEDTSLKWYVAQLASAFGVDYQEIAPLMTGNLGSSQQSEIMHLKTRGKGPALFMGLVEDIINNLVPSNVKFRFLEQDIRSEAEKANARFTRAKERSLRVKSGEIDGEAARQLAVEDGDLPFYMVQEINKRDEARQQAEEEIQREEFQADQIEGGMDSQNSQDTLTMKSVQEIRKTISRDPNQYLKGSDHALDSQ
jgi:hypothetical protein